MMTRMTRGLCNALRWGSKKIGFRGSFLLFLSILDVVYGTAILQISNHSPLAHLFTISTQAVGIVWIVVGVYLLTGVFVRNDRFQFAVAAMLKSIWCLEFIHIWIDNRIPNAWQSVAVWGAFAAVTILISFWPEPLKLRRRADDNNADQEA